jgi:hypothetical protein
VDWLWREPLPDPVSALLHVDREAYADYLRDRLRRVEAEDDALRGEL